MLASIGSLRNKCTHRCHIQHHRPRRRWLHGKRGLCELTRSTHKCAHAVERCCYVLIHATRKVEDDCGWLPLDPICPMLRSSQVQVSLALKTICPSAIACLQLLLLMQDLCCRHPCSTSVTALSYPGNDERSAPGHGPGLAHLAHNVACPWPVLPQAPAQSTHPAAGIPKYGKALPLHHLLLMLNDDNSFTSTQAYPPCATTSTSTVFGQRKPPCSPLSAAKLPVLQAGVGKLLVGDCRL